MIYMDNAATSWPKPEAVYRAMDLFMRNSGASPGRSGHRLSIEAGRVVYEAREALSRLFNVDDPLRVIFTKNATEALNLAMNGILRPGEHVITSSMEHNSIMRPLRALEQRGIELTIINCSNEGFLNAHDVEKSIKSNTRLVIMTHASNVVGTLMPVAEVGAIAKEHKVLFCVDAAQTAGAYSVDMRAMNIDLLAFSGHKSLFGPMGTGGLCISKGLDRMLDPLLRGGTGSRSESDYQPIFLPDKYESGTLNTVGLAGLRAGVEFVLRRKEELHLREEKIIKSLIEGMKAIPEITVYGSGDANKQIPVISFNISGMTSLDVAMKLDEEYEMMCRPGLHCAPVAHKTIGTFPIGSVRLSPGHFTTDDEIVKVLEAIQKIAKPGSK